MAPDFGGFTPWRNRHTEPEQRIHEELTTKARRRIGFAVTNLASSSEINDVVREYQIELGEPPKGMEAPTSNIPELQFNFIQRGGHDDVLTYLELLLNELWKPSRLSSRSHSHDELIDLDEKLRRILVEEGILLRLQPDREAVTATSGGYTTSTEPKPSYEPWEGESLYFERLSDATVVAADQEIRALGGESRWKGPLHGYNEAWEMYQDGQFSFVIAEKLYNSLEAVLEEICVSEGWNTPEDTVGNYLSSLREHGLFDPNDAMVGEWSQILNGIQVGIQRTGSDRKRHEQFDQDYAILLLHQVAAFLTFLIHRYEDYDS